MKRPTWITTNISSDVVDCIERVTSDLGLEAATIGDVDRPIINKKVRNSKTAFLPETNWVSGICMHYVNIANRDHFGYDITGISFGLVQYTVYEEGDHYTWHTDEQDAGQNHDKVRKLSFTLQLSDPSEYTGGELQLTDPSTGDALFGSKERGSIIVFESRMLHRVKKVLSGTRKSIVGWIEGPKWK